ncbi:MAG: type II toxin-antitoxin system VapC family toxin, partial [Bifidobacteriaceae bacterium]|nr:type II toxin-antitoxin system VapC family toxin [Bifidobacteriaceae bacterium]
PAHGPIEVLRTLRRYERAGLISESTAAAAASEVARAEVRIAPPDGWMLGEVWRLRHNMSPYDAPYAALALSHEAPLVTFDLRLSRAAEQLGAPVRALGGVSA